MCLFMMHLIKISLVMIFIYSIYLSILHYNIYHLVMVVATMSNFSLFILNFFNLFFPLGYLLQVNYNSKYEQVSNRCDVFLKHKQFVNDYVHIRFWCKL
jgi:hypothetical protein